MYFPKFHKCLCIIIWWTYFFRQTNVDHWDFSLLKDPLPKTASKIISWCIFNLCFIYCQKFNYYLVTSSASFMSISGFFCLYLFRLFLWLAQKWSSPSSQQSSFFFVQACVCVVLFSYCYQIVASFSWFYWICICGWIIIKIKTKKSRKRNIIDCVFNSSFDLFLVFGIVRRLSLPEQRHFPTFNLTHIL